MYSCRRPGQLHTRLHRARYSSGRRPQMTHNNTYTVMRIASVAGMVACLLVAPVADVNSSLPLRRLQSTPSGLSPLRKTAANRPSASRLFFTPVNLRARDTAQSDGGEHTLGRRRSSCMHEAVLAFARHVCWQDGPRTHAECKVLEELSSAACVDLVAENRLHQLDRQATFLSASSEDVKYRTLTGALPYHMCGMVPLRMPHSSVYTVTTMVAASSNDLMRCTAVLPALSLV
jgi:hypothetical protein